MIDSKFFEVCCGDDEEEKRKRRKKMGRWARRLFINMRERAKETAPSRSFRGSLELDSWKVRTSVYLTSTWKIEDTSEVDFVPPSRQWKLHVLGKEVFPLGGGTSSFWVLSLALSRTQEQIWTEQNVKSEMRTAGSTLGRDPIGRRSGTCFPCLDYGRMKRNVIPSRLPTW